MMPPILCCNRPDNLNADPINGPYSEERTTLTPKSNQHIDCHWEFNVTQVRYRRLLCSIRVRQSPFWRCISPYDEFAGALRWIREVKRSVGTSHDPRCGDLEFPFCAPDTAVLPNNSPASVTQTSVLIRPSVVGLSRGSAT